MNTDIDTLKREVKHLPPNARRRAERELSLPVESNAEHRVFVYGTLLRGECNERWAKGARRYPAKTAGVIYDTGFGYPAFVRKGTDEVRGELLVVDDEGFASMDRLEGYPRLYRREEIDVWTQCGKGRAWVYIMNNLPEGAKLIDGGDWRKYRAEKNAD